ncbi:hypothetical protein BBJ29_002154 [Phytophthora kernoviae]|uniref:protein O-GlcNAc transferase n=1 Tax=Phytophthora kernoviae TaxID=325452 RepID=A0A3F2RQS3_9STRA|nr:hypothetical protein BBP00_00004734 [Phytophthora kernoviae]RLN65328.1 hypothetical protein BBJ29_002154 [Phytophthora kernoviae]
MMLSQTELQVEIEIRGDILNGGLHRSRVCILMQPAYIPPDVVLNNTGKDLDESCFDQSLNYTTFHVAGLVPGLSYSIIVGLENSGNMIALSTRTFSVGSILLPGVDGRMSIADALEAGAQLHNAEDRATASRIYRYVLNIFPDHAQAQHLLGLALYQDGEVRQALPYLYRAVQANESDENFHNSLGICLKALGRADEGIQHYRRALELNPMQVEASINLGDAMQSQGKWEEAMEQYRKVATASLNTLEDRLEIGQAENLVKDATARMCELIRVTDGWFHADRCLNEALERWPDEPVFHNDRGNLLANAGQFETALDEYQRASDLGMLAGKLNVADTLEALGETQKSIDLYDQVIDSLEKSEVDPNRISFSTGITLTAHNRNNRELKSALGYLYWQLLHQRQIVREDYASSYGIVPLPYAQRHNPDSIPKIGPRRLRIGFVSRYIFNAAVGLYMSELIPQFDRNKYEIIIFAIGQSKSMKTAKQIEAVADTIVALPKDVRIAREEIRAWEMDVLVYPELGMDKTTYFVSLAHLAPIQAVWWGNADTSGVPAMDYYLASEHEHANFYSHYSEAIYQFKGMGIYHKLPALPKKTTGRDQVRRVIEERFDIPSDFRFYLTIEKQESMLMRAADAVVASLHLTRPRASLQAFAAGVPVVTFPNELWASRITYGFYQQMGINDLIATSLDEYVALAVKLATDVSFHKKMALQIKRRRSKLSEDQQAVKEWEKFFDFATRQIFPSGEQEFEYIPGATIVDWDIEE